MAFLAFPIGTLLSIQGLILVAGSTIGAAATSAFSIGRTLTRFLTQISLLTSKSLAPEFARLYAAGERVQAQRLVKATSNTAMLITMTCAAGILLFYGPVIHLWTHGKIKIDLPTIATLVVAAIASAYWQLRSTPLTSTNNHKLLAIALAVSSVAGLLSAGALARHFGTVGVAAGSALIELVMIPISIRLTHRLFVSSR